MKSNQYHESVMVREVIDNLHIKKGSLYIDATLGTAGHSLKIIEKGGKVLGIEADPKMLAIAKERVLEGVFVLGNFSQIERIARENGFLDVDGILFDLGVSNLHLKSDDRGFSFTERDQVLDMRLNPESQGVSASDVLNVLDKTQLTNLFAKVMKFIEARKMAEKVINNRPVKTVGQLKDLAFGISRKPGLDSATLPMLALRMAVNSELENLSEALPKAFNLLKKGGRLLVITFHSGEDEIVKNFMGKRGELILPSEEEIFENQRSRSARLRILRKFI